MNPREKKPTSHPDSLLGTVLLLVQTALNTLTQQSNKESLFT